MCSPYTRALQTAGLVFGHPESPGPRIHVMPELGEYVISFFICFTQQPTNCNECGLRQLQGAG